MTIAHAYTLLLEAAALAASFGILWLSFWVRDGRRPQLDSLVLGRAASGGSLTIDLASSDVQPASEQDETVLYRPEHAQHLNHKPQIEGKQNQRAHLEPMNSDPVKIHDPALLLAEGAALAQELSD
jgi:hypothetical protein